MELCFKVLFGLLLSLSILNEAASQKCNYYQKLQCGKEYYIYNPDYPKASQCACTWKAESPYPTKMECSIDITEEHNGSGKLTIQFDGKEKNSYCGQNNFTIEGINPITKFYGKGKMLCKVYTEKPKDEKNCQCGRKKTTRIVNGEETAPNEFPFMAGISDEEMMPSNVPICGGSIIDEKYVLTAAHCLINAEQKMKNLKRLKIVVGKHDDEDSKTNATKYYPVKRCVLHPHYDEVNDCNDIAICEVDGTIPCNDAVGPVCLPCQRKNNRRNNVEIPFGNEIVTALGWGLKTFIGPKATTLQKVDLNVIKCNGLCKGQMCTYTDGKDACQMDSGGPLVWTDPATYQMTLVGITCSGSGCAGDEPGIWTHVPDYIDWIQFVTGKKYC